MLPPPPKELQESLRQLCAYYEDLALDFESKAALARKQQQRAMDMLDAFSLLSYEDATSPEEMVEVAQLEEPVFEKLEDTSSLDEIDVVPRFQGKDKLKALEEIFEENRGKILELDIITRELYGKVPHNMRAKLKARVSQWLYQGKKQDLWFRVPNTKGCWTCDLTALAG